MLPGRASSPLHPTPPGGLGPPALGRRLGEGVRGGGEADGKGPGRRAARVPGGGGRPPAGPACGWRRNPGPVCNCSGSRKPFQCTCFLRAGLAHSDGGRSAAFSSAPHWGRALPGGWTEGARVALPSSRPPPPLAGSMAFRPLPAEAALCKAYSGHGGRAGHLWKPLLSLSKLLFWLMMSWK